MEISLVYLPLNLVVGRHLCRLLLTRPLPHWASVEAIPLLNLLALQHMASCLSAPFQQGAVHSEPDNHVVLAREKTKAVKY